jgi:hypothetical protein
VCGDTEKLCGSACVLRDDPAFGCGVATCSACTLYAAAKATCAAGSCAVEACAAGFADCDGVASNGCESNLPTSVDHCGQCGRPCALADATSTCKAGACLVAACTKDHADCDGLAGNGCEVSLLGDAKNCGGCGVVCAGAIGKTGTCVNGSCALSSCSPPFADCDLDVASTCETDMRTSPSACGSCGKVCALPHAISGCAASSCTVASCQPGFLDCDGAAPNGCEIDATSDPTNCGGCGTSCALPGAVTACVAGGCVFTACQTGTADLDGDTSNGCEYACPVSPKKAESCNGLDDDCDGVADQGNPGAGQACATGELGECSAGTTSCSEGATSCVRTKDPSVEIANGLDDDCDGVVDDGVSFTSCATLHAANPALPSGDYVIDPDGPTGPYGSLTVYCDMATDGGGYTFQKFASAALQAQQAPYVALCASKGLEIIVRRSLAHATSIYTWYGGKNPTLVNVLPNFAGAVGMSNWHGVCQGQPCAFWMNDGTTNSFGCATSFEPSGDNTATSRPWSRGAGCGVAGDWNDANDFVGIVGTVVCSTNDK